MDTEKPMPLAEDSHCRFEPLTVEPATASPPQPYEKLKVPRYICFILIANGFIKSLKFGEPYLQAYMREYKGLTDNQAS